MCGIFGFTIQVENSRNLLERMGQTMIHRGPDGEGYYVDDFISMGMRRLSILDLEKGNQPFFNQDESVVAFCNGEIYNYQELKRQLFQKGYYFETNNDVEVIPHLYDEYGIDFINLLNGMFAISLYDKKNKRLFLIRDRLGIKPLYYSTVNNSIIYSSEIKPILETNAVKKEIDFKAISTYLDLMYIPKPMSPFKNIHKLYAGSYLLWENGKSTIHRYWDVNLSENEKTETKHLEEVKHLLNDSIQKRLISDVPVGSFLSGGIDSSFVTARAADSTKDDFSVFHMRWEAISGKMDESIYAHKVANQHKVNKVFKDVNKLDVINLIPKLIYYLEEPFADAAFIPTYYLSKLAAENVKVILSGAGGDELFGGYGRHKNYPVLKSILGKLIKGKGKEFSYYDIMKKGNRGYWKKHFPWYIRNGYRKEYEKKYNQNKKTDKINAIMLNDIEYYLQDDILFLTDKMTMATSLECRVPLLDHRAVEYAQSIPSGLKLRNGEKKYLFKKLAEEFIPKEVIYRKKEGFGFPIWKLINENKDLYFDVLLENGFLVRENLIEKKALANFLLKSQLSKSESWFYWQIIVLEIWFQLFVEDKSYENIFDVL